MKITIEGKKYEGTPEELKDVISKISSENYYNSASRGLVSISAMDDKHLINAYLKSLREDRANQDKTLRDVDDINLFYKEMQKGVDHSPVTLKLQKEIENRGTTLRNFNISEYPSFDEVIWR